MTDDGVTLISAAHPRAAWWRRLFLLLRRPRLFPESLETIETDLKLLTPRGRPTILPAGNFIVGYDGDTDTYLVRKYVTDKDIEQEIQAKGKTAPRVTLADIEACIAYEYYKTADEIWVGASALRLLTLCVLVLKNGFTVTGESACASPENFDAELGRKIARQKAIDKVWAFEGYLLKEQLFNEERSKSRATRESLDAAATAKASDPLGRPRTVGGS